MSKQARYRYLNDEFMMSLELINIIMMILNKPNFSCGDSSGSIIPCTMATDSTCGRIHVEMRSASIWMETSKVVQIANAIKSDNGKVSFLSDNWTANWWWNSALMNVEKKSKN